MVEGGRRREPRATLREISAALAQLEVSTSHFDRRALLWALADQLPEGAGGAALVGRSTPCSKASA